LNGELQPLREEIAKLEDQINELTNGEFYCKFRRGLETYKLLGFGDYGRSILEPESSSNSA